MTAADRAAFTARMRRILDMIDADETIPLPASPTMQFVLVADDDQPAVVATIARTLGGSWKANYPSAYMHLTAEEDGVRVVISADADKVATPLGTRTVTVTDWTPLPAIAEFVQDPPEVTE